uniref:phage head spike fiber domain-containing protein n=1 Tax=Rhodobacter capsulatus TaxID=1061 RepID=UPI001F526FF9|nr:hypothetical protein [Rhodobacter capsulatus]
MTADKLVEDTSNNSHFVARTGTQIAAGTSVTASIFVKAAERRWFALVTADSANAFRTTYFDLQTGTLGVVSQGAAGHVAQIVAAGNGWYRCSVTQTQAAASGNFNFYPSVASANGATSYPGNGASGLCLWGGRSWRPAPPSVRSFRPRPRERPSPRGSRIRAGRSDRIDRGFATVKAVGARQDLRAGKNSRPKAVQRPSGS